MGLIKIILRVLQPCEKPIIFVLYVCLAFIFRYRKKVVIQNLQNSFPEKSKSEIQSICNLYYKHLAAIIVQSFLCIVYSPKQVLSRCSVETKSLELLNNFYQNKQSVILVMGHWGNWELGGLAFSLSFKHQLNVIYHPIKNKGFDNFMKQTRERFGAKAIAMDVVFKEMLKRKTEINATTFIADQSPPPEGAIWCNFLNQDTPFFRGTGVLAKKMNLPVFYIRLVEVSTNKYELQAELITDKDSPLNVEEIVLKFVSLLETDIRKIPQNWIWSHKRWKHKRLIA